MVLGYLSANAALTADAVMDRVAGIFTKHPSTTAIFSITSNGQVAQGNMTMCKDRFTFSAGNIAVWYDGRTQWLLQRNACEVNITEPTAEELTETNPLRVLLTYKQHYTCKMLTAPKGQFKIQLTSKTKGQYIKSATITINATDFKPTVMQATSANGTATVRISAITHGKALPVSYFTYDTKADRSVEIIDLR